MDAVISKLIPIFLIAFIGYAAGKLHILPDDTANALCSFLFYFCSPAVSFSNIINSEIGDIFNLRFALAMLIFELVVFGMLLLIYKTFFKINGTHLIIYSLCSFYGNIAYVGIPVFFSLFNDIIPNVITVMVHMLFTYPLLVFLLDWYSGKESRSGIGQILLNSIKNPNIFVPIIGAILLYFRIPIPQTIKDTADLLGKPTTTAGMFALGLTCSRNYNIRSSGRIFSHALFSALMKLIFCPVIAFFIGRFIFHLDDWWLNSMVIISMLPAALNDFILSQRYHSDEDFASVSVLLSTLLFSVTISLYMLFQGIIK